MTLTVTPADVSWFLSLPGTSQVEIEKWKLQDKITVKDEERL
jgi:hypothetical protein